MNARWYWQAPISPLGTALAVFDLPGHARTGFPQRFSIYYYQPGPDGRDSLRIEANTGSDVVEQLAQKGNADSPIRTVSTVLDTIAYASDDTHPFFFYPSGVLGSFTVAGDGAMSTHYEDFREAFFADENPRGPMPAAALETLRRQYLPLNQSLWVSQMCALFRRIRPAAMVAARSYDSKAQAPVWNGTGLSFAQTPRWFVLAYLQAGVSAAGLPNGLAEVPFADGKILYSPSVLKCDVAAAAAAAGAPDYDFDAEWEPVRQALANRPPQ